MTFSKLVFHGVDEELSELDIVSCITDFIKQLDVDWQQTREAKPLSTIQNDSRRDRRCV